jgi:hypothetical protein
MYGTSLFLEHNLVENTVRLSRPDRCQRNAQWIWLSSLDMRAHMGTGVGLWRALVELRNSLTMQPVPWSYLSYFLFVRSPQTRSSNHAVSTVIK